MELIVILGVIVIALIVGIWATREKPVENALEVLDNATPPAKPAAKRQPKVTATTGNVKKPRSTGAKKPATKAKTTRTRKTATK